MRALLRMVCALCLAGATAAFAAACGGGGGSGNSTGGLTGGSGATFHGPPATMSAAIDATPLTSWDSGYVEYGADTRIAGINGGEDGSGPWSGLLGWGDDAVAQYAAGGGSPLGFDPGKVTAAETVGLAPHTVTILFGTFDQAGVGAKLSGLGFTRKSGSGGAVTWVFGDGGMNSQNPIGPLAAVFRVASDRLLYGDSEADVDAVASAGGQSLGSSAVISALASCLGSAQVTVAQTTSTVGGTVPVGIGVDASSAQDVTEEVCVPEASAAAAQSVASAWAGHIAEGMSPRTEEKWSTVLADPQSTVVGGAQNVVRLTAKLTPGSNPMVLIQAFENADLSSLIGS